MGDDPAHPPGVGAINIDNTDRRAAEQEVRRSEALMRLIADALPMYVAYMDSDQIVRFANRRYVERFGREPSEIVGRHIRDILGEDRYRLALPNVEAALRGEMTDNEHPFTRPDGTPGVLRNIIVPQRADEGTVEGLVSVNQDVTQERQAAESVKQSEEKFSRTFSASPVPMVITRLSDNVLLDVNEHLSKLVGYSREEIVGSHASDLWENRSVRDEFIDELRAHGEVADKEYVLIDKAGNRREVRTAACIVNIGGAKCVLSIIEDVTDRNRIERELADSRDRLQAIIDTAPVPISIKDEDGRYVFVNRQLADNFQITPDAMIGRRVRDLAPGTLEILDSIEQQIFETGQPVRDYEFDMEVSGGGRKTFVVNKVPLQSQDGRRQILSVALDITYRKTFENALRDSEKNSSRPSA